MSVIDPEIVALDLDEAKAILAKVDWTTSDKFTEEERRAVVAVTQLYMMCELSAEDCAAILHMDPASLPPPWEHLRPS